MQVSLTESFNIVSADFVNVGVPIVISPDIDWLPDSLKADPNDHEDIIYTLGKAYSGLLHAWFQRRSLKCYISKSEDVWIEHMETFLPDVVFS
jgi:hypothetical protein